MAAAFPEEHQLSIDALLDLLGQDVPDRRDAEAIYHLAFGTLHAALRRGTAPTAAETKHVVRFCINGTGGTA